MTITKIMNELIKEAEEKAKDSPYGGAGAWRETEYGHLHVTLDRADFHGRGQRIYRKSWSLNGKRIAAKKLEAL